MREPTVVSETSPPAPEAVAPEKKKKKFSLTVTELPLKQAPMEAVITRET